MCERSVDCGEVLAHDCLASFAVGLADELLDLGDCFVTLEHAAEREEARLHDGIDPVTELTPPRNAGGVDRKNLELFLDDDLLSRGRKMLPNVVERAVNQL